MIALLGDIHGNVTSLKIAINHAVAAGASSIFQLGDFELFLDQEQEANEIASVVKDSPIPVYFEDGNHDDCSRWTQLTDITEVLPNLFYVPRGTVFELDGRTIAVMGGAASIDKEMRLRMKRQWDPKENITPEEQDRLLKNAEGRVIDLFLTHCPPSAIIELYFNPLWKLRFGVSADWTDPNEHIIEDLWHKLGTPHIYSGHMHRRIVGPNYRILDIDELVMV